MGTCHLCFFFKHVIADTRGDHCIDWLRSAAMCHADTSALATFKWDKTDKPMLDTRRVPHRCVDWEEMLSSHKNRMVSHAEVASMVNPALAESPLESASYESGS